MKTFDEHIEVVDTLIQQPIFEKEGKWYHHDEIWCDTYGPFDTRVRYL